MYLRHIALLLRSLPTHASHAAWMRVIVLRSKCWAVRLTPKKWLDNHDAVDAARQTGQIVLDAVTTVCQHIVEPAVDIVPNQRAPPFSRRRMIPSRALSGRNLSKFQTHHPESHIPLGAAEIANEV